MGRLTSSGLSVSTRGRRSTSPNLGLAGLDSQPAASGTRIARAANVFLKVMVILLCSVHRLVGLVVCRVGIAHQPAALVGGAHPTDPITPKVIRCQVGGAHPTAR